MIQLSFDFDCKFAKRYSFILHISEKIRKFDQWILMNQTISCLTKMTTEKKKVWKMKKKQYSFDFVDKYREYLIFWFSEMKRGERLWNDQLSRIRIDEKLFVQKKITD